MKISIWSIGKTNEPYLTSGIDKYLLRLKHYTKLQYEEFKDIKQGQTADETKKRESELFMSRLKKEDVVILLDEQGKQYDSKGFAAFIEQQTIHAGKHMVFIIGGAFGHHDILKKRADHLLSLSKMTFSHQMVRLFFVEQLYRAYTIIKNEKYHNV
ncbi:MAG: 23S rRNA (pseudouridine(1915)-N(3))-methyltransferase RlmH [Saprospiraceae bacterium]|jgi:23S rRNA (pseudouridine1915-N3)-methyltransferase|nr:23S rRNA (pseudouridine(1915)-N(3))-methyltransferase RlmH [Saprospiraceae bacterium]